MMTFPLAYSEHTAPITFGIKGALGQVNLAPDGMLEKLSLAVVMPTSSMMALSLTMKM